MTHDAVFQIRYDNEGRVVPDPWPEAGCGPDLRDERADVGVLRFEDCNHLVTPLAIDRIVHCLKVDSATSPGGLVVVVFVHGWNHNGDYNDGNFESFRRMLLGLARREAERPADARPRRVFGIYVGWRGLVWRRLLPQLLLTFPGRYRTAQRIGQGNHLQDSLARVIAMTKSANPKSPVVLVGHSLGAMMLESALETILQPVGAEGDDGPLAFPDLVIFLNSAAKAKIAKAIRELIKGRELEPRQIVFEGDAEGRFPKLTYDAPSFISVASEGDRVTQWLFPIVKLRRTDGNKASLFTHRLEPHEEKVVCGALPAYQSFGQPWHCLRPPLEAKSGFSIDIDLPHEESDGKTDQGDRHVRYRLTQEQRSPFWIFRMPREIGDGHNDVNPRVTLLLMALMQIAGATMSLASEFKEVFDPSDYQPRS